MVDGLLVGLHSEPLLQWRKVAFIAYMQGFGSESDRNRSFCLSSDPDLIFSFPWIRMIRFRFQFKSSSNKRWKMYRAREIRDPDSVFFLDSNPDPVQKNNGSGSGLSCEGGIGSVSIRPAPKQCIHAYILVFVCVEESDNSFSASDNYSYKCFIMSCYYL